MNKPSSRKAKGDAPGPAKNPSGSSPGSDTSNSALAVNPPNAQTGVGLKDRLDLLVKDHENALTEANGQAKQQFALSQLFVTVLFTAFGLAFEKKIEAVFAILPLFGGMCVVTLFWKDVIWYLAMKRVIEVEKEVEDILQFPTLAWGQIHGESYINYGFQRTFESRYDLTGLRKMLNACYAYVAFMYILVLSASIILWANGADSMISGGGDIAAASKLQISPIFRYLLTFFHLVVFGIVLYLWRKRSQWHKRLITPSQS